MGRKNAGAVNEGMCVLLMRLPALVGRLEPCPDEEIKEFLVVGRPGPGRDGGGCDRVGWDDTPLWGLESSSSSETMPVIREELYLMGSGSARGSAGRP